MCNMFALHIYSNKSFIVQLVRNALAKAEGDCCRQLQNVSGVVNVENFGPANGGDLNIGDVESKS